MYGHVYILMYWTFLYLTVFNMLISDYWTCLYLTVLNMFVGCEEVPLQTCSILQGNSAAPVWSKYQVRRTKLDNIRGQFWNIFHENTNFIFFKIIIWKIVPYEMINVQCKRNISLSNAYIGQRGSSVPDQTTPHWWDFLIPRKYSWCILWLYRQVIVPWEKRLFWPVSWPSVQSPCCIPQQPSWK